MGERRAGILDPVKLGRAPSGGRATGSAGVRAEPGGRGRAAARECGCGARPAWCWPGGWCSPPARTRTIAPEDHAPVHPALRLLLVSDPLTPSSARRSAGGAGRGVTGRPNLLQLLPAHGRRPDPLGHQRGHLLRRQPSGRSCDHSPAHYAGAARKLRATSGAGGARVLTPGADRSARPPHDPVLRPGARGRLCYGLGYTGHGLAARGWPAASWRTWRSTGRASC